MDPVDTTNSRVHALFLHRSFLPFSVLPSHLGLYQSAPLPRMHPDDSSEPSRGEGPLLARVVDLCMAWLRHSAAVIL